VAVLASIVIGAYAGTINDLWKGAISYLRETKPFLNAAVIRKVGASSIMIAKWGQSRYS